MENIDLTWLTAIISAHPWGAAVLACLGILATAWARDLLGRLVAHTATPYDDEALAGLIWLANALTARKYQPGDKLVAKARFDRQEQLIRSDPALSARAVEAGIIDAEPMQWPGD